MFVSLRRLLATVLELAQVRLELLLTEYEQEKLRIFDALLWAGFGLLLSGVGLLLLAQFLVTLFPDSQRLLVLGILTLVFLGGGAWLVRKGLRKLSAPMGNPLGSTSTELERDRAVLSSSTGTDAAPR